MQPIHLSETRRLLLWFFDEPSNDPYVSITFEVVIEPALDFLDAFAREHGERASVQHLVTRAVALAVSSLPAMNVKIIGSTIYRLSRVDLAVPVHLSAEREGSDETGMMILLDAGNKSLLDVARDTRRSASAERRGETSLSGSAVSRRIARVLPDKVLHKGLDLVASIARSPLLHKLADDRLAVSSGVTNVGSVVRLPKGARFRAASCTLPTKATHVASIFGVGPIEEAPVVEDGAVVARKVLPLMMVVDHRAIDGVLMAKAASKVAELIYNPSALV